MDTSIGHVETEVMDSLLAILEVMQHGRLHIVSTMIVLSIRLTIIMEQRV